ncbi:MAG: metallophosphoesterase [Candidatus Nanohaloarchaea archaeon]
MRIGIVSDTHDDIELSEKAVAFFEKEGVDKVIHCGDMVSPFTAELFDADFGFYYVRGNNDGEWNLKEAVEEFGSFYNNIAELGIKGSRIAVYHGTEEEIVSALMDSEEYDYVLRGHTHEKKLAENGETVEINPGGIKLPGQTEELHIALLDLDTGDIEFREIG